jgi:hypothetical protein
MDMNRLSLQNRFQSVSRPEIQPAIIDFDRANHNYG